MPTNIDWERQYRELETTLEYILRGFADTLESAANSSHSAVLVIDKVEQVRAHNTVRLVTISSGPSAEYSYYVYRDGVKVDTVLYSTSNTVELLVTTPGAYRVRAFARPLRDRTAKPTELSIRFEVK